MTQVFISYSRNDMEFVQRLATDLQRAGVDVWWDLSDIQGSDVWERKIEEGLGSSQYFIVVLTPASLESRWVRREYLSADNKGIKIIPLMLKTCNELPLTLRDIQPINAIDRAYKDVLSDVLKILNVQVSDLVGATDSQRVKEHTSPSPQKSDKYFFSRLVDLIFAKGSGQVDSVGTIPLILFGALAALKVLAPSDSTNQLMVGIFALLTGGFLFIGKQMPPTMIFKISIILYLVFHVLNYTIDTSFGETLEGIVALITSGSAIATVRAPKKPIFYSSISLALYLFILGSKEIVNVMGPYPNFFYPLLTIMSLITIILLVIDL